jgi:hypothetical protein
MLAEDQLLLIFLWWWGENLSHFYINLTFRLRALNGIKMSKDFASEERNYGNMYLYAIVRWLCASFK